MTRDGAPVLWLFITFIIIVYIGGYIWELHKENDRLYNIAVEQDETIKELTKTNADLHRLADVMFQYYRYNNSGDILTYPYSNNRKKDTNPVH